jgi:hypothetical protein
MKACPCFCAAGKRAKVHFANAKEAKRSQKNKTKTKTKKNKNATEAKRSQKNTKCKSKNKNNSQKQGLLQDSKPRYAELAWLANGNRKCDSNFKFKNGKRLN